MTAIGLAHLSLLHLGPDRLVEVASAAGFDFVGIRVQGATPDEVIPDQTPGSAMSRAVIQRLGDTGLRVKDIEFLSLDGTTDRETWLPMLDAGQAYGAEIINVGGKDPDRPRLADSLAELVTDAAAFGIRPALEPISYNEVATVADARKLASRAGASVMLDPLHIHRSGSPLSDVAALEPDLVPVVQLCDGPRSTPRSRGHINSNNSGAVSDEHARKVESRTLRLAPGEGEFALAALIRSVPRETPVSLEVPDAQRARELGDHGWASLLLARTRNLLREIPGRADAR